MGLIAFTQKLYIPFYFPFHLKSTKPISCCFRETINLNYLLNNIIENVFNNRAAEQDK